MTTINLDIFELTVTCIIIFVFVAAAIVLFGLITHLIYKTYKKCQNKRTSTNNKLIYILISTVIGISSFQISLLFTIVVVLQIFILHSNIFIVYLKYLIAVFDLFGHILMLLVFIARFEYAFKNEIFNQSKLVIRSMYIILCVLFIISLLIMIYVFPAMTEKMDLLILEIVWEFCVESMILLILSLFISNLHKLLRLSLLAHIKNGNKTDFLTELTKISFECSNKSGDVIRCNTATIDGVSMDRPSQKKVSYKFDHDDNNAIDHHEHQKNDDKRTSNVTSQTVEILLLINKMTVLVSIAAVGSFLTIVGNLIIEIYVDHDTIWVFILPSFHMVIVSFLLYLQFNFAHKVYHGMCHCLDTMFLKCMLRMMKSASFIVNNIENNNNNNNNKNIDVTQIDTKSSTINTNIETHSNDNNDTELETKTNDDQPFEVVLYKYSNTIIS